MPVDYAALAAQARQTAPPPTGTPPVDYAALAAQARAGERPPDFRTTVTAPDWMDRLVQWLPAAGGALGGVIGGSATLGLGTAPGAIMGAAFGGAAGEAYKELIRRARGSVAVPSTPTDAALAMTKEGAIQGAAQGAGELLTPAMSAMGSRVMQSAVKPGLKVLLKGMKANDAVLPVVKTLLDEGVNVTPGGIAKLKTLLESTNDEIRAAVASSPARIDPLKVAGRLSDTARQFSQQVNPQADLEAISAVGHNFLDHPTMGTTLSVPEAQALKQGTYARIGEKYGTAGAATIEAEKSLARGLKEEIAAEVPDISALNAHEGRLLEALHVAGKRVALAGNRDPIGFAWVAHNPTTFLAALIDRSPSVKSLLARGLYQGAGMAGKVSPQLIRVAVQALANDGAAAPAMSTDPPRQ